MATITGLSAIAGLLSAAADAVSKVGDSIAHLIKLGATGVDELKARRARSRLIDIRSRLVSVRRIPNSAVHSALTDLISGAEKAVESGSPSTALAAMWEDFTGRLAGALLQIEDVFQDVSAERSDFVLEKTYDEITGSLRERIDMIESLRALDPPSTREDVEALKVLLQQYDRLRQNLASASDALADYLKAQP